MDVKCSQANMDLPMKPLHPPWPPTSQEVYPFITAPAHFPGKSTSPSALEGHGLMPGMLKLGMAWPCDLKKR